MREGCHGTGVAAALLLDVVLGEPPARIHPTVLMGGCVALVEKKGVSFPPSGRRVAGVAAAVAVPGASFLLARTALRSLPPGTRWLAGAALTSTALSLRGLGEAATAVERELCLGDLERARERVGEIVGRDTESLSGEGVARAAVETVAENTSDGVVAPMLYALLFGAPGALAYRAVNTLDSMLGYREGPYRELGWAPARLDDLANLLPARLTMLAVALASGRPRATLSAARRFGSRHTSPNAGWAEAAFSGALGLRLGGPSSYRGVVREGASIGDGQPPVPRDVRRAVRLMQRSCLLLAAVFLVAERAAGAASRV
ncbi:MAG: cobalamin biosynthesis protein CobD [Rubrobacter sp.]|nr:cobalamin biosynthesis protein CobD [Rubrobacter sp.]